MYLRDRILEMFYSQCVGGMATEGHPHFPINGSSLLLNLDADFGGVPPSMASTEPGLEVVWGDFPRADFATKIAQLHVLLLCSCSPGGEQPPQHLLLLFQKLLYQLFP